MKKLGDNSESLMLGIEVSQINCSEFWRGNAFFRN